MLMKPMELSYQEVQGIYHPQIQVSREESYDKKPLGKYGQMALNYLKEEHINRYNYLVTEGTLLPLMHQVNEEAWERMEKLQGQMLQKEPIQDPTNTYQTYRHREMIRTRAEEIALQEIIFKER
ncbi:TnpV protein [Alkaliphilus pronyensis]|uniref:TnpV protein n=1 Tax=Alkaliphilus pronyensis TaxID=1482732 RepID=A0A6I0FJN1_9FIRM|nr:TnpV protein [Alkaliphilus pronyensis]